MLSIIFILHIFVGFFLFFLYNGEIDLLDNKKCLDSKLKCLGYIINEITINNIE